MAIVVVGGGRRAVGKTTLVCGLIAALKEFDWIAVKVTTHAHAGLPRVYEETAREETAREETLGKRSGAGKRSDTARFLAAGARRAFLLSADDDSLALGLHELKEKLDRGAHILYESNRVLRHVPADAVIAIGEDAVTEGKASYSLALDEADALAVRAESDGVIPGARPVFELAAFERIPVEMRLWLRRKLRMG
jgi:molybdopterin-guanine dinucleotide biosynthesis protein